MKLESRLAGRMLAAIGAAALCIVTVCPALADQLGQAPDTHVSWWRVIGAFILCIGLAVGAAFALKTRLRGGVPIFAGTNRRLQFVESLRLSHQVDICLFQCDGDAFIVAASPQGAVVVGRVEAKPLSDPQ